MARKAFRPESTAFDPDRLTTVTRHRMNYKASQGISGVLRERSFDQFKSLHMLQLLEMVEQ